MKNNRISPEGFEGTYDCPICDQCHLVIEQGEVFCFHCNSPIDAALCENCGVTYMVSEGCPWVWPERQAHACLSLHAGRSLRGHTDCPTSNGGAVGPGKRTRSGRTALLIFQNAIMRLWARGLRGSQTQDIDPRFLISSSDTSRPRQHVRPPVARDLYCCPVHAHARISHVAALVPSALDQLPDKLLELLAGLGTRRRRLSHQCRSQRYGLHGHHRYHRLPSIFVQSRECVLSDHVYF